MWIASCLLGRLGLMYEYLALCFALADDMKFVLMLSSYRKVHPWTAGLVSHGFQLELRWRNVFVASSDI